ncbi:MAG: PAS domain S-box protein [Proteobacteria bacterium]|nr:PAS domain S-box protein [Burkholderiales bacterium]
MRIRLLLIAGLVLAFSMIAIRLVILDLRETQGTQLDQFQLDVERISRDAASLLVLSQDYLLHESPRAIRQWHAVHADLSRTLPPVLAYAAELRGEVATLSEVTANLPALFQAVESAVNDPDRAKSRPRLDMLADHLVAETRRISDGAFELAEELAEIRRARDLSDQRVTLSTLSAFGLLIVALSVLVMRRVLRPLAGLQRAALAVQAGNLAARSGYRANDEFGALSRIFDQMTHTLQDREATLQGGNASLAASEASLAAARRDLQNILDAVPSVIVSWDRSMCNRFANQTYRTWFGIDPERMPGLSAQKLLGERFEPIRPYMEAALRGEPQVFERTFMKFDGSGERHTLTHYVPDVFDGEVRGFYAIIQDLTRQTQDRALLQQANDRFAIAADSADIGVWEYDPAAGTLVWDERMYRLYQVERSPVPEPYALWASRVHPDDRGRVEDLLGAALRGECDFDPEFRIVWPDGQVRHLKANARVLHDRAGAVSRMTGVNIDITERKRAELDLQETSSLLSTVLESASEVSIVATDASFTIRVFNAGAERLLGYGAEEVVGRAKLQFIHDAAEVLARGGELSARLGFQVEGDAVFVEPSTLRRPREWTYVCKDGQRVVVSLVMTAMRTATGDLLGYLGVAHDVTRQKQYEESLREAMQKAEQASNAKSQFLANMSHEIRTPMNAVLGLSYLLGRTRLDVEQASLLAKIQLASTSLLAVINDVLDLSKIEAGELMIECVPFSLQDLLEQIEGVMKVHADAKGIALHLEVPTDLPLAVEGDVTHLKQVLTNLLSNAIKFTDRGGVGLHVSHVCATLTRVTLRFDVRDTGIGIAPAVQTRLFTPFAQADASTTRRFGGTGLGLSIVKRLAHLMGGEVHIDSTPDVGSEFSVVLSFALAAPDAVLQRDAASTTGDCDVAGLRVLVVDDSAINLDVAKRILELEGASVSVAANGQEAFECLQASPHAYDVVLMDVQMPVLDGHQTTRMVRERLGLTDLPIIALTAGALTSERERAVAAGMDDFISKPFDPQALMRTIRRHVRAKQGARPERLEGVRRTCYPSAANWPQIAGIDAVDACTRLGCDQPLFRALLQRLLDEHQHEHVEIAESTADAASLVVHAGRMHKLRGSAGMLGAKALQQLAREAEAACNAGVPEAAARLSSEVWVHLRQLRVDARAAFGAAEAAATDARAAAEEALGTDAIGDLVDMLTQQNLLALDRFNALSAQLRQRLGAESYDRVRGHIDKLQFDAAARVLETVPG